MEYTIRQLTAPDSRKGLETAEVVAYSGKGTPVVHKVSTIFLWGQFGCTCCGDGQDDECEHVAIFKTWKRQGRPTGTWRGEEPRMYEIIDSVIHYWSGGKIHKLSSVARVLRSKGSHIYPKGLGLERSKMDREFKRAIA